MPALAARAPLGATLPGGVETGLVVGVAASLLLHLWRTSQPHIAEVGQVPGTEHYRNVLRHEVVTQPHVLALRMDESLYFANARALEDRVNEAVAGRPALKHVVLQCSAINDIDASALESLETINERLQTSGVQLHLSEVKGPVLDRLQRSHLLAELSGQVFLTHHQAVQALQDAPTPDTHEARQIWLSTHDHDPVLVDLHFTRASQQMALAALQAELDGLIAFFAAFGPIAIFKSDTVMAIRRSISFRRTYQIRKTMIVSSARTSSFWSF